MRTFASELLTLKDHETLFYFSPLITVGGFHLIISTKSLPHSGKLPKE